MFILICISADFDPVHKGHEKLINEARKIADNESKKLVVYLNKGFSANHAPFFVDFDARSEMALALGADEIRSFEGLHHRLVLSYSVPIRLTQMINDGASDYITSASISHEEISNKAQKFIKEGNFVGMPKNYTNRNEIRWYALNEFLGSKLKFHIVQELNKDRYSGRLIRQSIIDNDYTITSEVRKLLPKSTVEILEREI
ncbi:MAG: nucleotidyltransferase family protein, partial [Methanobrevibacter sp.]|nr:nucleotidyltransferase family protein [Methanobrevibacter sp.]